MKEKTRVEVLWEIFDDIQSYCDNTYCDACVIKDHLMSNPLDKDFKTCLGEIAYALSHDSDLLYTKQIIENNNINSNDEEEE